MEFEVGDVLNEKYEIKKLLGAGGMGKVYRARQVDLGRDVALKIPSQQVLESPEVMARFIREAKTVARMTHDNIVQVYEYFHEDDLAFIAMEFVEGQDLKAFVNAPPDDITLRDICTILEGACEGLDHAHEYGIVHRDIKPHNIMVARLPRGKWRVKVMDFGIAHIDAAAQMTEMEGGQLTQTGQALGTPSYMAPEQIRGTGVSHLSDLYSFGCVIYYVLTRQTVFSGSGLTVAVAHLNEMPPSIRTQLPGLPESVDQVILRCLEKDPAKRYQTAADLGHALHESLTPIFDQPMGTIWQQSLQAPDATIPIVKAPQTGQVSGSQLQEVQTKGTIDHSGFTGVGDTTKKTAPDGGAPPPANVDATIPGKPLEEDIKPQKKAGFVPIVAGVGVLALVLGVGAVVFLKSRGDSTPPDPARTASPTPAEAAPTGTPEVSPTPEPTEVAVVRPTITPRETPAAELTPTPAPTPTPDSRIRTLQAHMNIAMEVRQAVPEMYRQWRAIMELHRRESDSEFKETALSRADEVANRIVTLPEMTELSSDSFTMGNRNGNQDEQNEHAVRVAEFAIGTYEVTALEFATFLNSESALATLFEPDDDTNVIFDEDVGRFVPRENRELHPANGVTWYAAEEYTKWLTGKTGKFYRLPTEAEWERAARGTGGLTYPTGHRPPISAEAHFSARETVPVNEGGEGYGASLWNIGGNVAEWCADWYDSGVYSEANRNDPTGPTDDEARRRTLKRKVLRGGGFLSSAEDLSLTRRDREEPDAQEPDIGFRLALTP